MREFDYLLRCKGAKKRREVIADLIRNLISLSQLAYKFFNRGMSEALITDL